MTTIVTQQQISRSIYALGLQNKPICVHASLRSFGWVEGGPQTVIGGLLAAGCTVLMPTFSDIYAVAPLPTMHRPRNGSDYDWVMQQTWPGVNRIYTPASNEIEVAEMGTIPCALLHKSGRQRGNHPLCSFAAVGPQASQLVATQTPFTVNAPLATLAELGGSVLLMGVGLESMTLLHWAEQQAGRTMFRRWANDSNGQPMEVEMGGCSDGFTIFSPLLAQFEQQILVGESLWRCFVAAETTVAAADLIYHDPAMTHCGRLTCERCRDAVLGGPIIDNIETM